ncbi:MAG: polymerase III subunit beta protein [Candidatus Falkowbacteria bacterium GW2011_GWC2_38_22]|uniref:Beta sliding clamp n=1 Tax=Candidatus Falkowbacteria bacterium GW2011_GWE1_38_31 TaxID=1618638 RepID=A0A0G0K1M4_9BACT|nr:MAG: polymerase III subunit beta protein [Candidatus Falkowbacteria bacterium GW2011_GWF2_38_1205]KKQ60414.1 MAG: polymerase III subunit beta protein [Candidatus Falkowbacteria bacterium GW2011_GWC2_38_22]KKQ62461.1 MAG: polymerase III subunit beta protein [Candidatus Falkowbacteria bacterium GW2011_GWF1_38_22]KKQ64532.1 MAG: polymerase III subunit beta protein [Candidatus Falkowbacteria bacterium GW2011_GWE2_38_254]KKQ69370.1 MAG: polymerase III subunit beta protein [Candidatus Falkowbacter
MKISSLQENLKNSLAAVGHIAGKNINLPILNNVMIEAKNGDIKFITTDLEVGIVCKARGKIEKEGVFTVEAKIISDYISLLPNKKVDLEVDKKNLLIECENYKTIIKGQEADDFPLIPTVDKNIYFKLSIKEFKKILSQVVFAVANSETRIELSGVYFLFNKEKLTLAATDSYRLAENEIKIKTNTEEERSVIIPAKTLQEVLRILSVLRQENLNEEENELTFYLSDNQILFTVANIELVSRLIEGQYPDYKQIIPLNHKTRAIINKSELLRAVKAAALFSKTGINDINFDFPQGKNKVIISAASGQSGENITELDATVNGDDNGIVVNYRYLLDGINNIDSEEIVIELTNSNTPCILKSKTESSYLYIIMPIKQ